MRRHVIGLAMLTAAIVTPAWAEDKPSVDEKSIGTWAVETFEVGGTKLPQKKNVAFYVFAKDGKVTLKSAGDPDLNRTYRVTGGKYPKAIDARFTKFERPFAEIGIYELDGDSMKMAYNLVFEGGREVRPTDFDSSKAKVITLERQKP
jgi:uncharacterized protein (TIGR03067 family)